MHVLIVPSESVAASWSPLGGVFQVDLANAMQAAGERVGILSVGKVPVAYLLKPTGVPRFEDRAGVAIHRRYLRLPIPQSLDRGMRLGRLYSWIAMRAFAQYVERHGRPDVIHAHNVRYGGFIARMLGAASGIPYFVTEHSSEYVSGRVSGSDVPRFREILDAAAGVSAVSRVFADIISTATGLPSARITVLPNPLPPEFVHELPGLRTTVSPEFTLLHVGELVAIKNQELLLRAFASAFPAGGARLRIIGGGPLHAPLLALAAALGIAPRVDFLGRLPRSGVVEALRSADAFVLSSRAETFGVVLLEALACGVPVIATACGGPQDIVQPGMGLLVPPDDIDAMANAMQTLQRTPTMFDAHALATAVRSRYGPVVVARRYAEWFQQHRGGVPT